eukprot:2751514-Ditylum_brightwellii.AAC.1
MAAMHISHQHRLLPFISITYAQIRKRNCWRKVFVSAVMGHANGFIVGCGNCGWCQDRLWELVVGIVDGPH